MPRITGHIQRRWSISTEEVRQLRQLTDNPIKFTVPGPFTMVQQAQNDYYADISDAAAAYALAVRTEMADLFDAGVDIVQLDEPYMQARPEEAERYGVAAINTGSNNTVGSARLIDP